mmetsp:Transcript_16335/g.20703  ORF Transcript_16335/g.20703 Transcript_16335/m.20703 type:complete len:138 (+) Transcript_16335:130-543(+)
MLYFLNGSLPWQNHKINKNSARFRALGERKRHHYETDLLDGSPSVFKHYMQYCTALKFEEMPSFVKLKQMIMMAAKKAHIDLLDNVFDWSELLTRNVRRGSDRCLKFNSRYEVRDRNNVAAQWRERGQASKMKRFTS